MASTTACLVVYRSSNLRAGAIFHAPVEYGLVRLTFNQTKRVRVSPGVPFREYSSTVELLTLNQQVQGSNPCVPTILTAEAGSRSALVLSDDSLTGKTAVYPRVVLVS